VVVAPITRAVEQYERHAASGETVAAALHLTC